MKELIKVLEQSIKRNGPDKVVTLSHLLNLIKLSEKRKAYEEEIKENEISKSEALFWENELRYGSGD